MPIHLEVRFFLTFIHAHAADGEKQTLINHRLKSQRRGKSPFLFSYDDDDDHIVDATDPFHTAGVNSKSKFESTLSPSRVKKRSRSTTTSNYTPGPSPFRSQALPFHPNLTFPLPKTPPSSVRCIRGNMMKSCFQIHFNRF